MRSPLQCKATKWSGPWRSNVLTQLTAGRLASWILVHSAKVSANQNECWETVFGWQIKFFLSFDRPLRTIFKKSLPCAMPTPKNDALIAEHSWCNLQTSITDVREWPLAERLPEKDPSWWPSQFETMELKTVDRFETINIGNKKLPQTRLPSKARS